MFMFHEYGVNVANKNKFNGDINPTYLLNTITFYANEEFHSQKRLDSPIS